MLQVTSNIACAHFGSKNVNVRNVEDGNNLQYADRTNCGRSLYSSEETKHSTGETDKDRSQIRPRSRSFYVCDTDDAGTGHFNRCNPVRPRARSLHGEDGERNTGGTSINAKPLIKRPNGNSSKRASKDLTGALLRKFWMKIISLYHVIRLLKGNIVTISFSNYMCKKNTLKSVF